MLLAGIGADRLRPGDRDEPGSPKATPTGEGARRLAGGRAEGETSVKKWMLLALLLATPARAQDAALVEGFAEGFTFHSIFGTGHKIDTDGAVVYSKSGGSNTHIAAVR